MQAGLTYPGVGFGFGSAFSKTASISNQTTVTTSGSNNTKGSWVELESSTDYAVSGFYLIVDAAARSANQQRILLDVGIGGAGSEHVLVPDLLFSTGDIVDRGQGGHYVYIPMYIPAGTRVSARTQVNTSAPRTARVAIIFNYSGESLLPIFQGCDALGITTGSTSGVQVTSGSGGSYGAYTTLLTTSREYSALGLVSVGARSSSMTNSFIGIDIAVNRGSDIFLFRRGFVARNQESIGWTNCVLPYYGKILSSDTIKARCWATSTDDFHISLSGFY